MNVTWWIASGIILYHWSIAYELSTYCSSFIYFSVAIVTITTKYQKHYFCYRYLLLPLPLLSYYFATKYLAADIKFPGVVELTTRLLILENILWLPLCRINKFGLNTLPSKMVAIPYTCGLSARMQVCNTKTYTCTHEHTHVRTNACNTETYPCTHATLARLHAHSTRRKTHAQPIRACTLC